MHLMLEKKWYKFVENGIMRNSVPMKGLKSCSMRFIFILNFILFFGNIKSQQQIYQSGFSNQERQEVLTNISKLEPLFQRDPTKEMAIQLADAFLYIKKYKKAISYYEYALEFSPLSELEMANYFSALFEFGDLNLAHSVAKDFYVRFKKIHLKAKMDSLEKLSKAKPVLVENLLSINSKNNEYGLYPLFADYRIVNSDINMSQSEVVGNNKYMNPYIVSANKLGSPKADLIKFLENDKVLYTITHYDAVERKVYITKNSSGRFNLNQLTGNSSAISMKIYTATIDPFFKLGELVEFQYNSLTHSVGHATVSKDGQTLYFVSDMPGGFGGTDLYRCMKLEDGTWGTPINLGEKINTNGDEMFPYINSKGNTLYFSSTGNSIFGGLDINKSFKSRANVFGKPINLGAPFNSNKDDFAIIFTKDNEQEGFFSSSRVEGLGGVDVYKFEYEKSKEDLDAESKKMDASIKPLTRIKAYEGESVGQDNEDEFIDFKSNKPRITQESVSNVKVDNPPVDQKSSDDIDFRKK